MTPTVVRVMLSLALVPLMPWLYVEVFWLLDRYSSSGGDLSDLAFTTLIAGAVTLVASSLIWLGESVFRKGRGVRAAVVCAASIAAAGLLVAYHDRRAELELGLLLSVLLGVGVWYVGAGILARGLSAAIARVLYASALVPLVPLFYAELCVAYRPLSFQVETVLFVTTVLSGALLIVAWLGIWWRAVVWTPARVAKTALVLAGGILAGVAVRQYHRSERLGEIGFMLGGLCFAGVWVAGTAWAWRPGAADRLRPGGGPVETVLCPQCRYDLRGLREARCPECGTEYTLDALVRAAHSPPPLP